MPRSGRFREFCRNPRNWALTKAAAAVVGQHEARRTHALEAAGGVGARPKEADVGLLLALIDVWQQQGHNQGSLEQVRAVGTIPAPPHSPPAGRTGTATPQSLPCHQGWACPVPCMDLGVLTLLGCPAPRLGCAGAVVGAQGWPYQCSCHSAPRSRAGRCSGRSPPGSGRCPVSRSRAGSHTR